jgi:hypothetical protein
MIRDIASLLALMLFGAWIVTFLAILSSVQP